MLVHGLELMGIVKSAYAMMMMRRRKDLSARHGNGVGVDDG